MQEKLRILLVDDEERILRSLGLLLRMQYEVLTTTSGSEALRILREKNIHVIISDQRMPEMEGTEVLRQAREISPQTVRLLLTGYADIDATIASVNEGEVFRYINKPWGPKELRDTVALAAEVASNLRQAREEPVQQMPQQRLRVLVLDPDPETVSVVRELAGTSHEVLWAGNTVSAIELLGKEQVAVLVTELRLPGEDASALLKTLKREQPQLQSIVVTCFKDTHKVAELINQAQVFRYLPKPVRKGMLARSLESTIARYQAVSATPVLLQSQRAEPIAEAGERMASERIADYLQRLRARSFFLKGGAQTPQVTA